METLTARFIILTLTLETAKAFGVEVLFDKALDRVGNIWTVLVRREPDCHCVPSSNCPNHGKQGELHRVVPCSNHQHDAKRITVDL